MTQQEIQERIYCSAIWYKDIDNSNGVIIQPKK